MAASTTVYVLMYDIVTLHNIMREFPDIKEELEYLAQQRERIKLIQNQQQEVLFQQQDEIKNKIFNILERLIMNDINNQ